MIRECILSFILSGLISTISVGQIINKESYELINSFVQAVKSNDIIEIAEHFTFPLKREAPVKNIENKQEFMNRFPEIFDDSLKNMILQSEINQNWTDMGWRGIMFKHGDIWMDYGGKIIAVNYKTKLDNKLRVKLLKKLNENIHPSLRGFEKQLLIIETSKFRIRIDDIGNNNIRYASWLKEKSIMEKPDLILYNGELKFEGSGGNHYYKFKSGEYFYKCSINLIRAADSPTANLQIFKGEKEILNQEANIVK